MTDDDEATSATALSTRLPLAATPLQEVQLALAQRLAHVVEAAVEVLGVDGIGLMLLDDHDALRAAGYTNLPASALELVQAEMGQGPGVDATAREETIAVPDLAEAPRYAALWHRIADSGVRAVLASPVWVWGSAVGNLNAVRHRPHRWTETEVRANEAYAKVIGVMLDLAVQRVDAGRVQQPSWASLRT